MHLSVFVDTISAANKQGGTIGSGQKNIGAKKRWEISLFYPTVDEWERWNKDHAKIVEERSESAR